MNSERKRIKTALGIIFVAMLAIAVTLPAVAQIETIDAVARGTGQDLSRQGNLKVIITKWATPEDTETLKNAFLSGGNQGLVNALQRMTSSGRLTVPGSTGQDLAYAISIPTATGRRVRFVTNRRIAFQEAAQNTRSRAFNLTAGEIDINEKDNSQSSGRFYPAAQLIINAEGELQIELHRNPWTLNNIIVRAGRGAQ
jgi:hypothetical protein